MEFIKSSLLAAILLVSVVRSHGNTYSAPPEVVAKYRNIDEWSRTLSCLQGLNVSLMEHAYKLGKEWLDSAPEFRALALAEMEKPKQERGILDYVAEEASFGTRRVFEYMGVKVQEEANDARGINMGFPHSATNAVVQVPQMISHNRIGHAKSKKHMVKLFFLAKLFIYGAIAKAKVTLILFKIFLLVKLKFLALAAINTLIALAKLNTQWKAHHSPQLVSVGVHRHHQQPYQQQPKQQHQQQYKPALPEYGGGHDTLGVVHGVDPGWYDNTGPRQYNFDILKHSLAVDPTAVTYETNSIHLPDDFDRRIDFQEGRSLQNLAVSTYLDPFTLQESVTPQERMDGSTIDEVLFTTPTSITDDSPFVPMDPKKGWGQT